MSGIVDLMGREVSSGQEENETPDGNGATPRILLKGLLVLGVCSDGMFRQVRLNEKQAQRISNFMQSTCGGGLTLEQQPMLVQKIVTVKRPLTRMERLRRFFSRK